MTEIDCPEIIETLKDMTAQACTRSDGTLDSMGLSSNADALRILASLGEVDVKTDDGNRRVTATWRKA